MIEGDKAIFQEFQEAVRQAKTVFITAHVGPDGDTLGSMLSFKHAFEKACPHIERVDCVISGKMPDVYSFLPGIQSVQNMESSPDLLPQYDMAISVDCGSLDRLGPAGAVFSAAKVSVNLDHHVSNHRFGKINLVVPDACASGEVVYDLLGEMGIPIDANIATCIYAAILTDTGGFKYSNTTDKVFELAASLVRLGVNPEMTFKRIFEDRPRGQAMLHADALLHTQFNEDATLGWTTVTRQMLDEHGAFDEHIDGVVELIRQIDTVLIAAVFKETAQGETKISLRSDSHDINVSEIMERFGGGGHRMASGCTFPNPPEEARNILIPVLKAALPSKVSR